MNRKTLSISLMAAALFAGVWTSATAQPQDTGEESPQLIPQFKRVDFDPSVATTPVQQAQEGFQALQFESTTFTYGKVKEGETVDVKFGFKNVSAENVVIESVRASCGCTTPKLDKKEYAPGESGVIEAAFNTTGRKGPQSKTVTVRTSDPKQPAYVLTLAGEIVSEVYLNTRVVNFGDVQEGTGKKVEVEFIDVSSSGVQIQSAYASIRGLNVVVQKPVPYKDPVSGEHGQKTVIEVVAPPDMEQAMLRGSLTIRTNYGPIPNFTATITGRIVGEVVIEPSQAYFGILKGGNEAKRVARLKVVDGSEFVLEEYDVVRSERTPADAAIPRVDVELTPKLPNSEYQNVGMTLTAQDTAGSFEGIVVLHGHTANKEKMDVEIPFRLLVAPEAPQPAAALQPPMQRIPAPANARNEPQGEK
jgi:hypothetical protein